MPYWISDSLAGIPAFLWVYGGLGGIWSLAILPRADWRRTVTVIALAFAAGPTLLTVWMLALGTLGAGAQTPMLTYPNVLGGTAVLAVVGLIGVWRKAKVTAPQTEEPSPLLSDERLLIALVAAALVVRWFVIAYWPFTAYDSLWVYGYEGRLYALLGYIPQTIGYYPQFLPLQYAFAQMGGINDHVARAALPFLLIGSILAAYVLGSRLVNRRTGVLSAAIWALYPHVGEWSRAGDLEIPLAFLFALAAAFFLLAWRGEPQSGSHRRRYALIAGLLLGVGLWTKPTMGAFALGVGLLALLELLRVGFDLRRAWPRLEVALLTGLAAAPLGGIWYARNLLLGLPPLVFPPAFWQSLAQRSGGEFGWLLASLVVWSFYMVRRYPNYRWHLGVVGFSLVLLALVPTIIPQLFPNVLPPRRMSVVEFALLGAGLVALGVTVQRVARDLWDDDLRRTASICGWALALALPYFVTWFFSYSYHYRLSFAVVPLLILPSAAILAQMFNPQRTRRRPVRAVYLVVIALIAYPGIISAIHDPNQGGDYLWTDRYPDDDSRYRSGNAALMNVVDGLRVWQNDHPDQKLVVAAPGVDRLPFFFPLEDIRVEQSPTRLDQLDDAAYLVYGAPEGIGAYEGVPPPQNQVVGALQRSDIMRRAWGLDDGIFRYDVYELNLATRWTAPTPNGRETRDVTFGDFARYLGYDIGGLELWPGRRVIAHLFWQALSTPPDDYTIFIHLRDQSDNLVAAWDGPVARGEDGYYSTLMWQPGEYISDERVFELPEGVDTPGSGYRLVIGFYDREQQRIPVTVDGVRAGDSVEVENRMAIVAEPPS